MEQSETTAPEHEGHAPDEGRSEGAAEEYWKGGILPGILPPKMGSDSSSSSQASPHVPSQIAMPPEHAHIPIPASGFEQAIPQPAGSPAFQLPATNASQWPTAPQGILPPVASESSNSPSYNPGHESYQNRPAPRMQYDPAATRHGQGHWQQQMTMGHPMPSSYPLYAPPSYEIGADYTRAGGHANTGSYMYGANMQPAQTAYPHLYDPSYQMQQNQRLAAAGYGPYGRGQMQDQGGDPNLYPNRGREDRGGMRRGNENPDSARDPGPPIGHQLRGPDGANLFVFHIPNTMTNQDLFRLFSEHGNVLSATIKTEAKTGRGRGFGFVNFDSAEAASRAIHHLNGASVSYHNVCVHMHLTKFISLTLSPFFLFR